MPDQMIPMEAPLAHILSHLAMTCGGEAGQIATELSADVARHKPIPYLVSAFSILCAACDSYRSSGDMQLVDKLERLIASMKNGQHQFITGTYMKGAADLNQALINAGADGARVVALEHPDSRDSVLIGTLRK